MTQLAALFSKLSGLSQSSKAVECQFAASVSKDNAAHLESAAKPKGQRAPSPFRKGRNKAASKLVRSKIFIRSKRKLRKKVPREIQIQPEEMVKTVARSKAVVHSPPLSTSSVDTLFIPCPDPTLEDRTRDKHQNRALRLVRQEDWEELSFIVTAADRKNQMTPGGMSVAELMTFGARSDVVLAAEHALIDNEPEHDAPLMRGIEALEFVLEEHPNDYVIGCIVAQAHMDMAWAWRGIGWDVQIARRNREAFDAHFARAHDIVASFNGQPENSALLAATSCGLLRGEENTTQSVADRYEALIDLNPKNASPLRALGTHMLPRWYGSYQELELEARRTAARTQNIWGAGGYTWVMFDAISSDDIACARLDLPFFLEGLRDIVTRRPDPHTINLLAAYCANTMGGAFSGNDAADANRSQISECADWIVREHLTELHPMIWAHAAQGFANNLRVASAQRFAAAGQDDALRIIAALFRREIAEGKRIVFTDQGPIETAS